MSNYEAHNVGRSEGRYLGVLFGGLETKRYEFLVIFSDSLFGSAKDDKVTVQINDNIVSSLESAV